MNTFHPHAAFGAPGIEPRWTSSAKEGLGTAYHTSCRVWFTLSRGIVNEIYFPRVDQPNTRDFQFLISDRETFCHEENRDLEQRIDYPDRYCLSYRLTNTERGGRYRLIKEILVDPHRSVLLKKSGANIWVVDPGDVNDRRTVDPKLNDKPIVAGILDGVAHKDVVTTNGIQASLIGLNTGAVERWRFIHAGKENKINAQWLKQQGTDWVAAPDDSIEMHEIALDGIPTGDLLCYSNQTAADTHISLYPDHRANVLLRANHVKVGEVYALVAAEETDRYTGSTPLPDNFEVIYANPAKAVR